MIRKILAAIAAIIVCLILAVVIVLNTPWFRNFLRSEIGKFALEDAGARVEIGSVATHWSRLVFDLNNVSISVSHDRSGPPLLQAARIEVGLRFFPLLHKRMELSKLILDRPVIHLRIDAQGRSNLPVSPHPSTTSNTPNTLFNLEIGDFAIASGQIFYNDAKVPLDAELHDLKFTAAYSVLTAAYKGALSYDRGRLNARSLGAIDNAMQLRFSATRSDLSLSPLTLTTAASRLILNARIANYEKPMIAGTYEGSLSTAELAGVLHATSLPLGTVAVSGNLAYQAGQARPFLAVLTAQGTVRSDRLQFRRNQTSIPFTDVSAAFSLQDANLEVQHVAADILGGDARANFEMRHMDAPHAASRLAASLDGISLATISDRFASTAARKIPFAGATSLTVSAAWSGAIKDATAHARLTIASRPHSIRARSIPVNGLIQVDYDGPQDKIAFRQSQIQTANTKFSIAGTLSSQRGADSVLTLLATTTDLREPASIAALIRNAASSSSSAPSRMPSLGGAAALTVRATGSMKKPAIHGRLTAQNLTVGPSRWQSLALNVNGDSSGVSIENGALIGTTGKAQVLFSGSTSLHNWALDPNSPIRLQASAANIPVADAEQIAQLRYPLTGTLSAQISVSGTRSAPNGNATLTLSNASAWNEPIRNLTLIARSRGDAIQSTLSLQIPAGTVSADANYTLATQQYELQLQANGLHLAEIATLQKRAAIQGTANLTASGDGTIRDPHLQMRLAIPQLQVQGQTISQIAADITVANQHAALQLESTVEKGALEARADVALTGSRYTTASLDVRALPIAAIAAHFLPGASKVAGETEIHLTASGPLKSPAQMQAQLRIPTLTITYGQARIALARPLVANYANRSLTIVPTEIVGPGTNLTFGGSVPVRGDGAYTVAADGSINLASLQQFAPSLKSSGQIAVHIHTGGSLSKPSMQGRLQIQDAVFSSPTLPIALEGLNAQIDLSGNRADIVNFSGAAGGGTVSAHGFATLGSGNAFNVALNAQSVRMLYPAGLRSVLTAQLNFRGDSSSSFLTGRVTVDNLSFTQQYDLASLAAGFSSTSTGAPPSSFTNRVKLNIAIASSQQISLATNKLSVGGSANLNVVGTMAQPVVLGRIALTGGEVFFLGKRFQVQSGTIQFSNPVRTEPVVRLFIATRIEQYDITLNLTGPVDRLRTNYTSDPALPPSDIIHLLAFGTTTEEAAAQPSQGAAMGAESVLAQSVGSSVAGRLENLTGISQLTINPLAASNAGQPGRQVAIQERVTGSLLFTFSTNLTTTQGQTVQLQYDLNKRVSVTILRDPNGAYGIDLNLRKVF